LKRGETKERKGGWGQANWVFGEGNAKGTQGGSVRDDLIGGTGSVGKPRKTFDENSQQFP